MRSRGALMSVTQPGSPGSRISRNELIEEALCKLLAPDKAEVPSSPEAESARQEIENICADFAAVLKEAEASPRVGEARQALRKMADDATALAERFRRDANMLIFGAATFNPSDTPEQDGRKQEEIESAKDNLLSAAMDLDRIAKILRERIHRWTGKATGKLRAHQMVHGNPGKALADAAAQLFAEHRPNDLHASPTGDFFMFVRHLYEAATDCALTEQELLRACQDAVKTVHSKQ